jgi:ABC-2 type transport system permease protein
MKFARIAKKELTLFFASPIGYLFLAGFLAVTLFVFFWGQAFFARNIADVRPMFEWMPLGLLFLAAALTMRMWSEERRAGTLEFVMTVPASTWSFVLGKFLACWALVGIALLLTLPLPLSISLLADLDWGPVWAGYLAAMLLGGAYIAVGLFVSSRSDNQIVSLLLAMLAGGLLYLVGSPLATDLVTTQVAEWLRSLGTGARFESITRGVIDFRDLYYYASLVAVFLALNVYALQREGWAREGSRPHHHGWRIGTTLLVANVLIANVWLAPLTAARLDVTEGRIYSISDATRSYLEQLQEPLLIRGYFSSKTHPLLAPLVPQLKDLMTEYAVAGGGSVRVEFVDPARAPDLEDEANSRYGIRPVPFQVADRHQASLVNAYFDVLLKYGDEHVVLGFRDLIEVKAMTETDLDVRLRNPEYDLTRGIRKVLYGFQSGGDLFASLPGPLTFRGFVSDDRALPRELIGFRQDVAAVLDELASQAGDRLRVEWHDPQAGNGEMARRIEDDYGFRPMFASLFDRTSFYFYLTLSDGERMVQIPLPEELDAESFRRTVNGEMRRFAPGYLRTVALVAPESHAFMGFGPAGTQYSQLADVLGADYDVQRTTLEDGRVPQAAEVLIVVDPDGLSARALFAIDQYLMQGGTVVIAAAPFATELTQFSLNAVPRMTGLESWLQHHGLGMEQAFVMDPNNTAFPVPVTREVGGFQFQELRMLDYPYFVDVRAPGLNPDSPITSNLPQITMPWVAPIVLDEERNASRRVTPLLRSSPMSWLSDSTDVMPRIDHRGGAAYTALGERETHLLGVLVEGRFDSYFSDRPHPLLANGQVRGNARVDDLGGDDVAGPDVIETSETDSAGIITSVVTRSPDAARLFVFGSNDFLSDQALGMIGAADGTLYANTLQLVSNVVDWSLEDRQLLAIRGRSHFGRTLPPLTESEQQIWEYGNYGIALLGLGLVFLLHRGRSARRRRRYQSWLIRQEG